jgi:hypothetical protein
MHCNNPNWIFYIQFFFELLTCQLSLKVQDTKFAVTKICLVQLVSVLSAGPCCLEV